MKKQKLMLGDNITSLKKLPDNSIDSVVTDPPYGLSFMGKKWDYDVPSVEFWKEVYRVLKPGGHILSFGGTRTYHRMVVNIEDAGFEIRDQIQWIYASGFPKSLNVGKAVDKLEGNEREVVRNDRQNNFNKYETSMMSKENRNISTELYKDINITKGQTEWEGWGSALKPANEPICLARKPLSEKSIAENVLKWRTGGLNIDGCRIESHNNEHFRGYVNDVDTGNANVFIGNLGFQPTNSELGRFPANLILDETAAEMLDEQSGVSKSIKLEPKYFDIKPSNHLGSFKKTNKTLRVNNYSDKGGASRFFYVAKVSKAERNMGLDGFEEKEKIGNLSDVVSNSKNKVKNNHPTVKPINLMSYLCKLITPPNGIVLDPFMGSGSTGIAALLNDFRFVGMEMDSDYFKIAEARINNYEDYKKFLKK